MPITITIAVHHICNTHSHIIMLYFMGDAVNILSYHVLCRSPSLRHRCSLPLCEDNYGFGGL